MEAQRRNYQFFNHTACEFYPCHDMPAEELNCLFCYCPLYALGPACGGAYRYVGEHADIKDCSACTLPHRRENYGYLMERAAELQRLAAPSASRMPGEVPSRDDASDGADASGDGASAGAAATADGTP